MDVNDIIMNFKKAVEIEQLGLSYLHIKEGIK